jgi:hypothetical protein
VLRVTLHCRLAPPCNDEERAEMFVLLQGLETMLAHLILLVGQPIAGAVVVVVCCLKVAALLWRDQDR